jgi:hypothetical protein
MELTKFWVVRDPCPVSEMVDICFETTMNNFRDYCGGLERSRFLQEKHTLHTSEMTAKADAQDRLDKRDGRGPHAL